jgi:hypothetical protein
MLFGITIPIPMSGHRPGKAGNDFCQSAGNDSPAFSPDAALSGKYI